MLITEENPLRSTWKNSKVLGLANGEAVDPYNYVPSIHFDPKSVARSLSNICRYNGHYGWMSVAEHCLIVSNIMGYRYNDYPTLATTEDKAQWRMLGLLHDSMESVFGDITSPVKGHPDFENLRQTEHAYLIGLYTMHGIYPFRNVLDELHAADRYAMSVEIEHLGYYTNKHWKHHTYLYPREYYPDVYAVGITNERAELLWLEAYEKLVGEMNGEDRR